MSISKIFLSAALGFFCLLSPVVHSAHLVAWEDPFLPSIHAVFFQDLEAKHFASLDTTLSNLVRKGTSDPTGLAVYQSIWLAFRSKPKLKSLLEQWIQTTGSAHSKAALTSLLLGKLEEKLSTEALQQAATTLSTWQKTAPKDPFLEGAALELGLYQRRRQAALRSCSGTPDDYLTVRACLLAALPRNGGRAGEFWSTLERLTLRNSRPRLQKLYLFGWHKWLLERPAPQQTWVLRKGSRHVIQTVKNLAARYPDDPGPPELTQKIYARIGETNSRVFWKRLVSIEHPVALMRAANHLIEQREANAQRQGYRLLVQAQSKGSLAAKNRILAARFLGIGAPAAVSKARQQARSLRAAGHAGSELLYHLGVALREGQGGSENSAEALQVFSQASEYGSAAATLAQALLLKDPQEKLTALKKASEAGYPPAKALLGQELSGSARDALWRSLSADTLGEALYQAGKKIQSTAPLAPDAQAMPWLLKAAALGYPAASKDIGEIYRRRPAEGRGMEQNLPEAAKWLARADFLGDQTAGPLRTRLAIDNPEFIRTPDQVENDIESWIEKLSQEGEPELIHRLADAYAKGLYGIRKNPEKAKKWFTRLKQSGDGSSVAAAADFARISAKTALMTDAGANATQVRAALSGHPEAQIRMAKKLLRSKAASAKEAEALALGWMETLCERGEKETEVRDHSAQACLLLGSHARANRPDTLATLHYVRGLYERCSTYKNMDCHFQAALTYVGNRGEGKVVDPDPIKEGAHLKIAIQAGHAGARAAYRPPVDFWDTTLGWLLESLLYLLVTLGLGFGALSMLVPSGPQQGHGRR